MRHAVLASPFSGTQNSPSDTSDAPSANVLEHLIEFIQYAYGHYSQLFEDPTVAVFRAAWIEQLGDLARYRMAVAGLASRVYAAQQQRESQQLASSALASASQAEDSTPIRREDAASIGQAALNDWDLEEQETWREMARDWYAQGVGETPGTGRLQHHLALLSKGEGDELKGLYHYAKRRVFANSTISTRCTDFSPVLRVTVLRPRILISPLENRSYPSSIKNINLDVLFPKSANLNSSFIFTECYSPRSHSTILKIVSDDSSNDYKKRDGP